MEEWKTIDIHEGYEVSNMGNVRNKKTGRILNIIEVYNGLHNEKVEG
jgi:hypothetical protein